MTTRVPNLTLPPLISQLIQRHATYTTPLISIHSVQLSRSPHHVGDDGRVIHLHVGEIPQHDLLHTQITV